MVKQTTDKTRSAQTDQSAPPPTRESARASAAENLTRAREIIDTELGDPDPQKRMSGEVRIHGLISIATEWRYLAEAI